MLCPQLPKVLVDIFPIVQMIQIPFLPLDLKQNILSYLMSRGKETLRPFSLKKKQIYFSEDNTIFHVIGCLLLPHPHRTQDGLQAPCQGWGRGICSFPMPPLNCLSHNSLLTLGIKGGKPLHEVSQPPGSDVPRQGQQESTSA